MKDAYYFSHDSNARNDEKILQIRELYGWEGYGLYWGIIEVLRDSSNYKIKASLMGGLSIALSHPKDKLLALIQDCIKFGLLEEKDDYIWSESLLRRMRVKDEMRALFIDSGKKGAEKRWGSYNPPNTPPNSKVKESKVKESKDIPPIFKDVSLYCQERGSIVDARRWFDFYQSKGWLIGKTPMKDWKAAVRTWEKEKPKWRNI